MLKRILVALDPDSDTAVATQSAIHIAQRYDAEVAGLAIVDTGYHDTGAAPGSMYYEEKLRQQGTAEGRKAARRLIEQFEAQVQTAGVRFADFIQEGDPEDRIVEDLKYFDLLVIGHNPHFLYSKPGRATKTLEEVITESVTPTLIVEDQFREVSKVLIAFDGSQASARAVQRFAQLKPFGPDLTIELIHIYGDDSKGSEQLLAAGRAYLEAHGFKPRTVGLSGGNPIQQILDHATGMNSDLLVVGANSVSALRKMAFGSTTSSLIKQSPIPLFMDS